jgi:hypothetical protein
MISLIEIMMALFIYGFKQNKQNHFIQSLSNLDGNEINGRYHGLATKIA